MSPATTPRSFSESSWNAVSLLLVLLVVPSMSSMRTQSLSKEVSTEASRGLSNSQLLSGPFDEDIFDDESAGHSVAQGMWVGGMVLAEDIVFL